MAMEQTSESLSELNMQTQSLTYTQSDYDQFSSPKGHSLHIDYNKTPKPRNKPRNKSSNHHKKGSNGFLRTKTDPRDLHQSKKAKRAKRSKQEQKKWKKKMKEIGRNHPEFELSYDLLLGIRTSTSTVNSSVIRSSINPMDDDSSEDEDEMFEKEFKDSKRYSFPSSGSSQTPPHHMNDFEFKDYCRPIFAQLREWFGIKPQTYLVKLCGGFNLLEFISNSKSGQFFFYSHDGQFLIKSMTRSECKLMRKILPQYYYFVKNQPNTLLTKFYGMYRVKTHNRQPIYFVVMGSVFYTDLDIHKIYDIKGSTHGRRATEKDKKQETPVLKDLDFLENNEILYIGSVKAKLFIEQLRRDTELLRKLKIMDYSLLLGIHYSNRKRAPSTAYTPSLSANMPNIPHPDSIIKQLSNTSNTSNKSNKSNANEPPIHVPLQSANEFDKKQLKPSPYPLNDRLNIHNNTNQYNLATAGPLTVNSINTKLTKQDIQPKQSVTDHHNGPSVDISEDEDEKIDTLAPLHKPHGLNNVSASNLNFPALHRVPSRRISQITTNHNRFTVKTPIENNFDMPELVDFNRIYKEEPDDNDDDGDQNIFCQDKGGMHKIFEDGRDGQQIYFCGIIDVLQKYNKRKKVENFFRGLNTDTATISAVPPEQYSQRMYDFLKGKIK